MSVTLYPNTTLKKVPAGWFLLRGCIKNNGAGLNAKLHMDMGSNCGSQKVVPIPITRKGTVLELIKIPKNCSSIHWTLEGDFDSTPTPCISILPVTLWERIVRMLQRVVPMFYKHPRRKRLRAGLTFGKLLSNLPDSYAIAGKFRAYSPQLSYTDWLDAFDLLSRQDLFRIRRHLVNLSPPRFSVIVVVNLSDQHQLYRTLSSLSQQICPPSSVIIAGKILDEPQISTVIANFQQIKCKLLRNNELTGFETSDWFVYVNCGDTLAQHALYWIAAEQAKKPDVRIIYTDDDEVDDTNLRSNPRFKPDWSLEYLRSVDYISPFFAFHSELLDRKIVDLTVEGHDLLLQFVDVLRSNEIITHIPALLYHRYGKSNNETKIDGNAVKSHLARNSIRASVVEMKYNTFRVRYMLPENPPLVTIIIPTRDAVDMLRRCIESIINRSNYRKFEILVLDNQSSRHETHVYFKSLKKFNNVQIVKYDEDFNYSAMNNLGVSESRGEVICLLNNDTEVISPDWLEEMLGHLHQDGVGIVGAKLYYPDGRVQHGGDTVGPGGCAHHLHSFLSHDDPGYCKRAIVAQDLSAVTAACLMTWRQLYLDLGGLDEHNLTVAFNDVDFCLRVRQKGYRVIWTPHAELFHHESASRGKNDTPEKIRHSKREADYMRKKWNNLMHNDPFYNINLSYERPDFSLSNAPLVQRPWNCH